MQQMLKTYRKYYYRIYIFSLVFYVFNLVISRALLSISLVFLVLIWFLDYDFRAKWKRLKKNKAVFIFLLIYILQIVGLLYTSNFTRAFVILRVQAPLVILPVVIGSMERLSFTELKVVLYFFATALNISILISTLVLFGFTGKEILDIREISVFFNHIRLALLTVMSVYSLVLILLKDWDNLFRAEKLGIMVSLIWQINFVFLLRSLSGIILFVILLAVIFFYEIRKIKQPFKAVLGFAILFFLFVFLGRLYLYVHNFTSIKEIAPNELPKYTVNGNLYKHDTTRTDVENGNRVWLYVCEDEMRNEWNKVSSFKYDGLNKKGNSLKSTLKRYLTSWGYTKDSVGISMLSPEDIGLIERGFANKVYLKKYSIYPKIYETIWQIWHFKNTGYSEQQSVSQRLVSYKIGFEIIKDHFWVGVGTGDVIDTYHLYYGKLHPNIEKKWRIKGANQYISYFVKLGLLGFIIILGSIFVPVYLNREHVNMFFIVFFIIALLSMFVEDTLNYQIGASFYAFFYCIFLFGFETKS